VINLKWGLIAAISAFLISAFLGVFSGVALFHIIIRALIFAGVFFGMGFGLRFIINSFFPEILFPETAAEYTYEQPGSRINITMDNTGEYAVPELFKSTGDYQELGNIEDLISGVFSSRNKPVKGVDAVKEPGYNDTGDYQDLSIPEEMPYDMQESFTPDTAPKPAFTPSFGDDAGLGGLPDLDMMARAFSSAYSGPQAGFSSAPPVSSVSTPVRSVGMPLIEDLEPSPRYKGNKPEPLKGDFNPKELAEGLRAVLSKDK